MDGPLFNGNFWGAVRRPPGFQVQDQAGNVVQSGYGTPGPAAPDYSLQAADAEARRQLAAQGFARVVAAQMAPYTSRYVNANGQTPGHWENPGHLAGGTNNWHGGPTWVGEAGPELLNLPRHSQVVPNALTPFHMNYMDSLPVHLGVGGGDTSQGFANAYGGYTPPRVMPPTPAGVTPPTAPPEVPYWERPVDWSSLVGTPNPSPYSYAPQRTPKPSETAYSYGDTVPRDPMGIPVTQGPMNTEAAPKSPEQQAYDDYIQWRVMEQQNAELDRAEKQREFDIQQANARNVANMQYFGSLGASSPYGVTPGEAGRNAPFHLQRPTAGPGAVRQDTPGQIGSNAEQLARMDQIAKEMANDPTGAAAQQFQGLTDSVSGAEDAAGTVNKGALAEGGNYLTPAQRAYYTVMARLRTKAGGK